MATKPEEAVDVAALLIVSVVFEAIDVGPAGVTLLLVPTAFSIAADGPAVGENELITGMGVSFITDVHWLLSFSFTILYAHSSKPVYLNGVDCINNMGSETMEKTQVQ